MPAFAQLHAYMLRCNQGCPSGLPLPSLVILAKAGIHAALTSGTMVKKVSHAFAPHHDRRRLF